MDWLDLLGCAGMLFLAALAAAIALIAGAIDRWESAQSATVNPEPVWIIRTPLEAMPPARPTYCPVCAIAREEQDTAHTAHIGEPRVCQHHLRALREVYASDEERAAVIDNLTAHAAR